MVSAGKPHAIGSPHIAAAPLQAVRTNDIRRVAAGRRNSAYAHRGGDYRQKPECHSFGWTSGRLSLRLGRSTHDFGKLVGVDHYPCGRRTLLRGKPALRGQRRIDKAKMENMMRRACAFNRRTVG
jgi:hypothetical protein